MGNRFAGRWKDEEKQHSLLSKIKNIGKSSQNVKQQISSVTQRIEVQTRQLDLSVKRFEKRDAGLFERIVKALSERDTLSANVFAGELSEIRKVEKMLMQAQLALESVSLRLNTVSELGDLVTILAPAANVLSSIRSGMAAVFPEVGRELENIGDLLSDIVSSTNQNTDLHVNVGKANAEAEKILQEAESAAEERLKKQLPDVSTAVAGREKVAIET